MDKTKPSADQVVASAVRLAVQNKGSWAKVLFIPVLMVLFANGLLIVFYDSAFKWPLYLVNLASYTVFAVAVHRLYLVDTNPVPTFTWPKWTKRETYFALCFVGLIVLAVAIFMAVFLLSILIPTQLGFVVGQLFGVGLMLFVLARCSLVFPASAINHGLSFRGSWQLTKNHQLLILLLAIGIPFVFAAPMYLLQHAPFADWIGAVIELLLSVIAIGCLSLAYRQIMEFEQVG